MIIKKVCVTLQALVCLSDMNEEYIVPLNGLSVGKKRFSWHLGKAFFADSEILDADLTADVTLEKSGSRIGIDAGLEGWLKVPCDRCLEDLVIPVSEDIRLDVKFGSEPAGVTSPESGEDRETLYLSEGETSLDMAQIIYDYAVLALPLQRVHPAGGCSPEAMRWISSGECPPPGESHGTNENNSPFAVLRGMFE